MDGDAPAFTPQFQRFDGALVLDNSGEHNDCDGYRIRVYSISRVR